MSSLSESSCGGCGKDNHRIYFCGNIQNLNAEDIEMWLRSIDSPPFVHIIKGDRFGVVHCDTYEDACNFFHKMKFKKFIGPSNTTIKFSEARELTTKRPIKYVETTSIINSISGDLMIPSTPTGRPKKRRNNEQIFPDLISGNTPGDRSAKKQKINPNCTKSADQVESLKTKIMNLQNELLLAQKVIIGYQKLTIQLDFNNQGINVFKNMSDYNMDGFSDISDGFIINVTLLISIPDTDFSSTAAASELE
ncbi:hypothetical protein C1645_829875 [Glomus cerebriforme]|uniref:RRM domain-containing protein n=1 Tax=Glomus cerebriforme TaxID=658196 RepID=A0A397SMC4_9GLOM|nr:hypothetical protein C1645_829875 [Glomus cerebriforme]